MASFAVCKQFRPRLDTTELLIYTRGESTMGATTNGGETTRGKRLGGETTRGGNGLGAKRTEFLLLDLLDLLDVDIIVG